MIQEQFFQAFELFAREIKHFYQKNTRKNSQMQHEIPLAKSLLRTESQLPTSLEQYILFAAP